MVVVIYGNDKDTTLNDTLMRALANYGGVQFHSKNKVICACEKSSSPRFLAYDVNKLPVFLNCEGILIFKDSFKDIDYSCLPPHFSPVFDSQNVNAENFLKDKDMDTTILTCGVSSKNILTISSIEESKAFVSFQRYTIIKDKIIEPHDFTVNLTKPVEPEDLLFTCAVLLLSGIPSADGYEF